MTDAGAAPPPPTLTFRLEPPGRELRRAQQAPPSLMLSSCRDSEITGTPRALPSVRVHRQPRFAKSANRGLGPLDGFAGGRANPPLVLASVVAPEPWDHRGLYKFEFVHLVYFINQTGEVT
ncbi:hypothetical protein CRG98_014883 [Punica granatum]|uniref:Uncharacterized protein n=1 Tax=Punica granatum TaxID=22663 RepID=A0A2I0K895_PUNGR|nr:hypothetical protein CRG98_014883 [Punica granatum]